MNKNMLLLSAMLLTASVAVVDVRAATPTHQAYQESVNQELAIFQAGLTDSADFNASLSAFTQKVNQMDKDAQSEDSIAGHSNALKSLATRQAIIAAKKAAQEAADAIPATPGADASKIAWASHGTYAKITLGAVAVAGLVYAAKNGHLSDLGSKVGPLSSAIKSRLPNVDSIQSLNLRSRASDLGSKVGPLASAIKSRLPNFDSMQSLNLRSKASGLGSTIGAWIRSAVSLEPTKLTAFCTALGGSAASVAAVAPVASVAAAQVAISHTPQSAVELALNIASVYGRAWQNRG